MKLQASGKTKWLVYQKIVIVFVAFLVPLISINLWVNYKGMTFTKDAILDSALAGSSFYAKQLDRELYFVRNQQLQFLNDNVLQKLSFRGASLESYDQVVHIEQVRDRLFPILESSEYVLNAGVYIASVAKTISTRSGVTNIPNSEFELVSSMLELSSKPSFYQAGDRLFFIETENNAGIWSYIEISRPKLLESLQQIATLSKESEVFLGDEGIGSVLSTSNDREGNALEREFLPNPSSQIEQAQKTQKVNGVRYYITHNFVGSLNLSLVMYVNQDQITRTLDLFVTVFYVLFGIVIVILVSYSYLVNVMIHRPLSKLVKAFHMIETDNLNLTISSKTRDEFHYLFYSFNRMAHRLKRSIEENYEQKMMLQQSELKQLQSQINPHFLYNSFFNIYMLCKVGDSDSAAELSQKLGSYYQYITRSGSNEVLLMKELQHALDYCEIQCIRFSNRISYQCEEIPEQLQTIFVPRLIIQPIVENAFDHAFEDGMIEGIVYIEAGYRNESVFITVEDNGQSLTDKKIEQLQEQLSVKSKQTEKTGLINVSNRLSLIYGSGSGLFISRSPHGGLKVELIIHLSNKEAS